MTPHQYAAAAAAVDDVAMRSRAAERDAAMAARLGSAAPDEGYADFADPTSAADSILAQDYMREGLRTLQRWQDSFYWWGGSHYTEITEADVRAQLYDIGPAASARTIKKRQVDDVLDALRARANLSHRLVPAWPAWIDPRPQDPDPRSLVPVRNGLVQVGTGELLPATPRLFVPYCVGFDYTPNPPPPIAWFSFLVSIWPDDPASIDCLQEWFGYLLAADTSLQKALMIVGPRRGGKGTIGRTIVRLVGERNVASPTLASLGTHFGLEPLIGRTVALLSDARIGAQGDVAAIAENLLRISGEDAVSIDRKFRAAFTARLLARIVILSNEVPVFRDAASALPSRFIVLRTTRSFYGAEDHELDAKLAAELPGIFCWALDGLRRLRQRGRFVQPPSAREQVRLMADLASPVSAFVDECCVHEPGATVPIARLYQEWREWCRNHGRDLPGTEQTFGRDIAAALPQVDTRRPRIDGLRVRVYLGIRLRTPGDAPCTEGEDEPL